MSRADVPEVPFYMRVFFRTQGFIKLEELNNRRPPRHVDIYVLPTTTLEALPYMFVAARSDALPYPAFGLRLLFQALSPASAASGSDRLIARDIGNIVVGDSGLGALEDERDGSDEEMMEGSRRLRPMVPPDDSARFEKKTLQEVGFRPGDILSVAVLIPGDDGLVPDAASVKRQREREPIAEKSSGREYNHNWTGHGAGFHEQGAVRDRGWGVQATDEFNNGRDRRPAADAPRGDWKRGGSPSNRRRDDNDDMEDGPSDRQRGDWNRGDSQGQMRGQWGGGWKRGGRGRAGGSRGGRR